MLNRTITHFIGKFGKWLAIALLMGSGWAMAQTAPNEPTLKQIYDTAQAGQLDKAQTMVQQVLVLHPNSAKAHFVQAELFARQGQLPKAREALAAADKLAPGLPFAKSEAIQSLRAQLDAKSPAPVVKNPSTNSFGVTPAKPPAAPANTPWGLILLVGAAAIALVVFLIRRKPAQTFTPPAAYANPGSSPGAMPGGGLNGPQTFGMGSGAAPGAPGAPGYGQAPGQPYGQPPAGRRPGDRSGRRRRPDGGAGHRQNIDGQRRPWQVRRRWQPRAATSEQRCWQQRHGRAEFRRRRCGLLGRRWRRW
jgi:uncharacterized protein